MRNKIVALSFVEMVGYAVLITGAVTKTVPAIVVGISMVVAAYVVGIVVYKRSK